MKKNNTILIIGAHPADPVDLAGGAMALHSANGDKVVQLALTDGTRSHGGSGYGNDIVLEGSVKRSEFKKAGLEVGVSESTLAPFQDEPLLISEYNITYVTDYIREVQPDVVITHHPEEYAHWDHSETGKIVCRALKGAMKLKGEKWWAPTVYFFAVHFRPESARVGVVVQPPDVLIDITTVVRKKVEALYQFASQGHNNRVILYKRMNSFESEMGRADGLQYSEGFILYMPLKTKLLPVNPNIGFYNKK